VNKPQLKNESSKYPPCTSKSGYFDIRNLNSYLSISNSYFSHVHGQEPIPEQEKELSSLWFPDHEAYLVSILRIAVYQGRGFCSNKNKIIPGKKQNPF
jgi:hypothetical protein